MTANILTKSEGKSESARLKTKTAKAFAEPNEILKSVYEADYC